jgi:hypothetical protein
VLFLPQHREFLNVAIEPFTIVVVSRVRQSHPIAIRRETISSNLKAAVIPRLVEATSLAQPSRTLPRSPPAKSASAWRSALKREMSAQCFYVMGSR